MRNFASLITGHEAPAAKSTCNPSLPLLPEDHCHHDPGYPERSKADATKEE